MASVTLEILISGDDIYTNNLPQFFTSANYADMGNVSGYNADSIFRFDNVGIGPGSTIITAYLRLRCKNSQSGETCNLNIYFEDAADPDAPSDRTDYLGRSLTSVVAWDNLGSWTSGTWYQSPELKTILQEVIDLGGWDSGQALIAYVKDNGSSTNARRSASSYDDLPAYSAELYVEYSQPVLGLIQDDFTISDDIEGDDGSEYSNDQLIVDDSTDAFNLTVDLSDDFTIDDSVGVQFEITSPIADDLSIDDDIRGGFELQGPVTDDIEISDSVDSYAEWTLDLFDDLTISDLTDAFNWSEFLRENQDIAIIRYYFTLTGDADGTTDIEIPISSFQARKRSDYSTQATVVIPDYIAWASSVTQRSNGSILIDMAYLVSGVEQLRERILEVELDDIRLDKGSRSRAITLTGTRSQDFGTQVVAIPNPTYRYLVDGKIGYRFSVPDPWINPGDTCQVGSDEFTVDWVNYSISQRHRSMEVRGV